jgi:predicted amidohydrolase YtcJ
MSTTPVADLVVRATTVHTMDPASGPATALAVREGRIVAIAGPDRDTNCWPPGAARQLAC